MSDDLAPTVEVTQHDRLDEWRRGIAATEKAIEEERIPQAQAREEAARAAQYAIRETLYFLCRRLYTKEGQLERVRAEVISGMPDPSMRVWADGEGATVAEACDVATHEGRFRYAEALFKAKVCPTWEAAKDRAAKTDVCVADVVGP